MSESPFEPGAAEAPQPGSACRRWQFSFRSVILLVVVTAEVGSMEVNLRRAQRLAPRVAKLRSLARELDIADPRQFAAISRTPEFVGDSTWDVYVPDGGRYRLCVATRGVDASGTPPPAQSAPIAPGRHRLTLMISEGHRGTDYVALDGAERRLTVKEPGRWTSNLNAASTLVRDTTRSPAAEPMVLLRRRYEQPDPVNPQQSHVPEGPTDGLMFWIEPVGTGTPGPSDR